MKTTRRDLLRAAAVTAAAGLADARGLGSVTLFGGLERETSESPLRRRRPGGG